MKKSIIVTVLTLAALSLSTPVMAEEAQVKVRAGVGTDQIKSRVVEVRSKLEDARSALMNRKVEVRAELDSRKASTSERMVERKTEIETRQASSTEKRIERQQDIAKRQAEHTAKVLGATIERLEKLVARVEARIAKVKAEGKTTVEAEGFVAETKVHLDEARKSVEVFSSIDLSADKAKENFAQVRTAASDVKTHLREAHESLMKAVRVLAGSN